MVVGGQHLQGVGRPPQQHPVSAVCHLLRPRAAQARLEVAAELVRGAHPVGFVGGVEAVVGEVADFVAGYAGSRIAGEHPVGFAGCS